MTLAHEFTHGVTQATAGLMHGGESGALNEGTSDFFASMVAPYPRRGGAGSRAPRQPNRIHWLDGDHSTVLKPPLVSNLARAIRDGQDRSSRELF